MAKVGFLENSNGESSHTKLINVIVALCIMIPWSVICVITKELVDIPPTLLGVLFFCMGYNSLNKKLEGKIDLEPIKKILQTMIKVDISNNSVEVPKKTPTVEL